MFSLLVRQTEQIANAVVMRINTNSTISSIFECLLPPSMGSDSMSLINYFNHPLTIFSIYGIDILAAQNYIYKNRNYYHQWVTFTAQPIPSEWILIILLFTSCCGILVARYIVKYLYQLSSSRYHKVKRTVPSRNQEQEDMSLSASKLDVQLRKDKMEFIHRVGYDVYGYKHTPGGFIDDWRSKEFPTLIPTIPIQDTTTGTTIDKRTSFNGTNDNNINNNFDTMDREVYVDYAGAALPTQSQMIEIQHRTSPVLGNPHSMGPAAARTKVYIEQVTRRILDHFHAHPGIYYGHTTTTKNDTNATTTTTTSTTSAASHSADDHPGYDIIFTSGTTDAIRIVAEQFPWGSTNDRKVGTASSSSSSLFVYAQNSHTSVIGVREVALQHNSATKIVCQPMDELLETIIHQPNLQDLEAEFRKLSIKTFVAPPDESIDLVGNNQNSIVCQNCVKHLLVVPLECNFSGDRPDAQSALNKLNDMDSSKNANEKVLCGECQQNDHHQSWYTMLDIAKAASTGPVNLCELNPDFAAVSFYKMFGEPTGLGCLFVKRTAIDILFPKNITKNKDEKSPSRRNFRRRYVGGGSVNIIVPGTDYTVSRSEPSPLVSLQSGTPHFRGIVALLAGFNELDRVGGMESIRLHTQCLRDEFVRRLQTLRHGNGRNAIIIYGNRRKNIIDTSRKMAEYSGPIVAFNVLRADGSYVGYNEVSKLAALYHSPIQLRTGCFCNPGACQIALELSDSDLIRNYEESGHVCGDPIDMINHRPTGAIRISFGKDSTWEDMNVIITFLQQMFVCNSVESNDNFLDKSNYDSAPTKAEITELYIFPIKSCAAQRVTDWQMDPSSGRLRFDREFALVDASGAAMRLQMYPAMAQLRPIIDLKTFILTIHAPDPSFSPLVLDLDDELNHALSRKRSTVKVCGNRCSGVLWGDHIVSQWFSRYLGVRCWLARHTGKLDGFYEYPESAATYINNDSFSSLSFANEQPLLLISEHAVKILNDVMRQSGRTKYAEQSDSVCSRQFRPNIVVRFGSEYVNVDQVPRHVEDSWNQITILDDDQQKDFTLEVVGPCARCAMVDIDPTNGHRVGTLRALATYRRSGNAQITFGIFVRASPNAHSLYRMKKNSSWLYIREGNILLCE